MGGHHESRIEALSDAILDYLRRHPDASDTATGIVQWWLPEHLADGAGEHVDEVLKRLSNAGALRCVRLPDGTLHYGAATRSGTVGNRKTDA